MTNDLEFETHIRMIHREENLLDHYAAEKKLFKLTIALTKIQQAAKKANKRLQELGDII